MKDQHGIQADRLAREYKGGIKAVDGIDLRIQPGEIYGFLGPNGAGKSTTVHMLTTLLPPTSGTARVAGFDIVKQGPYGPRRHRRGAAGGRARPLPDRARAPAAAGLAPRPPPRRAEAAVKSCSSGSVSREPPTARSRATPAG